MMSKDGCFRSWAVAIGLLALIAGPGDTAVTEALTDTRFRTDALIVVDSSHRQASDKNPGSIDLPLRTIGRAAELAMTNNEQGAGSRIEIAPGTYRERIVLPRTGRETQAPIVFEAKSPGTVVVSGSDIWNGWKKEGGVYTHHWPYTWGMAPDLWRPKVRLAPIVRRREMVFVNGVLLEQALSLEGLRPGGFYVSEPDRRIYINSKVDISNATVEVAVRSGLFVAEGKSNIALRGLTFQHDTTAVQGGAVWFNNSRDILIEDCRLNWNNWGGLRYTVVENAHSRRNVMNHNGGIGWMAYKVKNLISEDDETSYNNWRGAGGGLHGWGVAGTKHLAIHGAVYRRHKAIANQTVGFWLDYNNTNIVIEEGSWCGNLTHGMYIEASQGPIVLKDSRISHNNEAGVFTTNTTNVALDGNQVYGNVHAQIHIDGLDARPVTNWVTKQDMNLRLENWSITNNEIAGPANHLLIEARGWRRFIASLTSNHNRWYRTRDKAMVIIQRRALTLPEWQAASGQDLESSVSEFVNNDRYPGSCDIQNWQ